MKTIRLLYPDHASGGIDTYYFGANLLQHILPSNSNQPLIKLDYFEIVDERNMQPINIVKKPCLCAIAAYVGKTRLIDNFYYE